MEDLQSSYAIDRIMNSLVYIRRRTARLPAASASTVVKMTKVLRFGGSSKLVAIPAGGAPAGPLRKGSSCSGVLTAVGRDMVFSTRKTEDCDYRDFDLHI